MANYELTGDKGRLRGHIDLKEFHGRPITVDYNGQRYVQIGAPPNAVRLQLNKDNAAVRLDKLEKGSFTFTRIEQDGALVTATGRNEKELLKGHYTMLTAVTKDGTDVFRREDPMSPGYTKLIYPPGVDHRLFPNLFTDKVVRRPDTSETWTRRNPDGSFVTDHFPALTISPEAWTKRTDSRGNVWTKGVNEPESDALAQTPGPSTGPQVKMPQPDARTYQAYAETREGSAKEEPLAASHQSPLSVRSPSADDALRQRGKAPAVTPRSPAL